jgi:drug/metabolite transporter (DMT)-like permease
VAVATLIALIAFASNSILCRVALESATIDPATFTAVRVVSGAVALALIALVSPRRPFRRPSRAGWTGAFLLFAYAIAFSYAYLTLGAGTGALLLFGCVQTTMLVAALKNGERPRRPEWLGLLVAVAGLVYLVSPGLSAPSPAGAALMAAAGVAWGLYSLRGRGSEDPLRDTARNFLRAVPLALLVSAVAWSGAHAGAEGIALAAASGAISSGLGYVIWYAALRGLTATRAATVQLSVPVIAAFGGVAFLGERVSLRLAVSAAMILGGVGAALAARRR